MQPDPARNNPDPRSPVQPPPSSAPYLLAAAVIAIALWGIQQARIQDIAPDTDRIPPSAAPPPPKISDPRQIFSADDYPAEAQSKGEQGTAQAKLTVDTAGRVTDCVLIRKTGSRSLDEATCRILKNRARFKPARDSQGDPMTDIVVTPPITWRLEE
ncbi:energy transducer TonB [Sphingomonas sp. URHD0057]|uniref:energy transducer TonB n=1 Tax=Sphingomonas sp. URHD0057 TaxID=1380389 RepID=UPI0006869083|nr:energy transducer TonB [Sphingomonas sp. URHD0057]